MEYTILYKNESGYPTHLCDVFSDDEIWDLTMRKGWRVIE